MMMKYISKVVLSMLGLFLLLSFSESPAAAHGGGPSADIWDHWSWQDIPLLILIGTWYTVGLRSLWKQAGFGNGISWRRVSAFSLGMIVLFVALVSPLDALSEELLTVHMIQHLLIVLLAAPLFVLGRFALAFAWVLPARSIPRQWTQTWHFLIRPMTASLLHASAIWIWHMPRLYEASLHNEWIHFLEHASFFVTALWFWQSFSDLTANAHMGRSAKFGMGILSVFGLALASGLLGVLIAFSPYVWYPTYLTETTRYGLTALEDQQLAGTIMWIPSGVVYLLAAVGVMARWLFAMEALENPQG